jgi:hypothetical protein
LRHQYLRPSLACWCKLGTPCHTDVFFEASQRMIGLGSTLSIAVNFVDAVKKSISASA